MMTLTLLRKKEIHRALQYATGGFLLFNLVYLSIFYLVTRVTGTFDQLRSLWPWGLAMGLLLGVQSGLYGYARSVLAHSKIGVGGTLALSGGGSLGSMIACCAHLLVLFIPLVGVSFLASLLGRLQVPLLYLALFINAFSITTQLIIMKRHGIFPSRDGAASADIERLKTVRLIIVTLSIPVVLLNFTTISTTVEVDPASREVSRASAVAVDSRWTKLTDTANMVAVSAVPILDDFKQGIGFRIAFETHSVNLDFDPAQIAELTIDQTVSTQAVRWDGPSPGGHHIAGELWFAGRQEKPVSLKLQLRGIADKDREFIWR